MSSPRFTWARDDMERSRLLTGEQTAIVIHEAADRAHASTLGRGFWVHVVDNQLAPTTCVVALVSGVHVFGDTMVASLALVGLPPVLEVRIPRPVASSKNRRRLGIRGGIDKATREPKLLPTSRKSADAARDARMLRLYAGGAANRCRRSWRGQEIPFAPDDAIRLDVYHDIETDEVILRAVRCGSLPARGRKGTKRDVHGMIETVADALEGIWYDNDRQIDRALQQRNRWGTA